MSDYRKLEERLRERHLLGDCVLAAGVIRALMEENERLREALLAVRALIWPIGSWATIGEAVPMVSSALDLIDAALSAVPSDSPADVKSEAHLR
jgi:hypothetical protein